MSSVQPSPSASRVLPPLPADVQLAAALRDNLSERRRRSRGRGIETSIEENTLDPNHLKSGRPVPPRPAPCALDSRLSQGASRGLLALSRSDTAQASTGTGGESGSGMAVLERAVSRLIDTEACLKAVDDSIQDLRSGEISQGIVSDNEQNEFRIFRSLKRKRLSFWHYSGNLFILSELQYGGYFIRDGKSLQPYASDAIYHTRCKECHR